MSVPGNLYTPTIRKTRGGDYLIEQSLLFDGTSTYLNRTPSVAGNRKTWSFDCWVKRSELGVNEAGIFASESSLHATALRFDSADNLNFRVGDGSTDSGFKNSTAVFRDTSSWYHIACIVDTTNSTAADRIQLWVNGTRLTDFSASDDWDLGADSDINKAATAIRIGYYEQGSEYFSGAIALPRLIDGAAVAITDLLTFNDDNTIQPKEFTGTTTQKQPDLTGSSNIGNMTGGGGLAAAFDGTTSQASTAGAALNNSASDGTVGKDWGSGNTKTINKAVIIGPNDTSIVRNSIDSQGATTVYLEASTDNFSASTVTLASTSTSTASAEVLVLETTGASAYRYHRIRVAAIDGSSDCFLAEVQFYEDTANSFGTNGGVYDFADTDYFGKDAKAEYEAVSITFRGSNEDPSNASSYSETAAAIGAADADRHVFVAAMAYTSATDGYLTDVDFTGGIAGELVFEQKFYSPTSTARSFLQVWKANVPTGTTTDIDFTANTSIDRLTWAWWTADGDAQILDQQVDLASDVTADNSLSVNLFCPDNGFVLALHFGQGDAGDPTITFGGTGISEDFEEPASDVDSVGAGASGNYSTAGTNTLTCTNGTGNQYYYIFAGLSFVPAGDNSFASTGFTSTDQLADSPTDDADLGIGNYPVLVETPDFTLSEGNRKYSQTASNRSTIVPFGVSSGKWYWELKSTAGTNHLPGITDGSQSLTNYPAQSGNPGSYGYYFDSGLKYDGGSTSATYGTAVSVGETVGVCLDMDNGALWYTVADVVQDGDGTEGDTTKSDIAAYNATAIAAAAYTGLTSLGTVFPLLGSASLSNDMEVNFGQKGFLYTPPDGFQALATQNLPAPTIADGSQYFNTVLWTGDGVDGREIDTGMSDVDLVWIKPRTLASGHSLYDRVRGAGKRLQSESTNVESTNSTSGYLSAFNGDGTFDITSGASSDTLVNDSGENYVAWCWKANGAGSTNTDGSITSTVSANQTSGFSIVTYTGTGAVGTVGHGLGVNPDFAIFKNRDQADNWRVAHKKLTGGITSRYLTLNSNATETLDIGWWTIGSSTFTLGTSSDEYNASTEDYVAYLWAEVEGFSKFGSYTGNGSTDGPFIYTGFRPAFILWKPTSATGNWNITDSARSTYNITAANINPNTTNVEGTAAIWDFVSNGFKIRNSNTYVNGSGTTYIYAAFAENPFQGDDGVTQARAR